MRFCRTTPLLCLLALAVPLNAQRVIPLYAGAAPGSESWTQTRVEYFSTAWGSPVVANVSKPSLTVFLPPADKATGTSVVICPGGGFYALSIGTEGTDVAKWLAARGVAAFVLEYRLVKTGKDAPAEFAAAMKSGAVDSAMAPIIPLAVADGLAAVAYVRSHAAEFGIAPDRVGLMGFSAGGTIVAAVAYRHTAETRPAFLAAMYAYTYPIPKAPVPADAPPLFVAAADDDDDLGLHVRRASRALFEMAGREEIRGTAHLLARGGHGFGMHTKHQPSDTWIERFSDWLGAQELLKK